MVHYQILDFKSKEEYIQHFFKSLLPTNRTYDYFVSWEKIKKNVHKYVTEISLLNSLTKMEEYERESKLEEIIKKYPEVIPVIPLIIAIREKSIVVLDIGNKLFFKTFNFTKKLENNEIKDIVEFCKKSGILNLFGEINDLYAYLLGMEVGLDSNARKNRSGKIFEGIVELLIKKKIEKSGMDLYLKTEDSDIKIKRNKRADFVIYHKNEPKMVIECNFYGSTGSKPIETANAYIDLEKKLKEKNLVFVWITDGPAWKKMRKTVENTFDEISFPVNYTIFEEKFNLLLSVIQE